MKNFPSLFRKTTFFLALIGMLWILASWNVRAASANSLKAATVTPTPEASATPTEAPTLAPTPQPTAAPKGPNPHNSGDCLACHGNEKMIGKFSNGDTISLYIKPAEGSDSFHMQKGVGCRFCHQDQQTYPHKNTANQACSVCHYQIAGGAAPAGDQMVFDLPYEDARAISLSISEACRQCHAEKYDEVKDSAHTRLLQEGNRYAPVCADCHSGHKISTVDRLKVAKVCSQCHLAEYSAYKGSVHGAALEKEFNFDVPTCSDCHGAHDVVGPSDNKFRENAATEMCGKCHANQALMSKYGISTNVLSTYLDDVHGQTDLLGRLDDSNYIKATCYDCHGTHNILSPKNPYSKVYPDNLQKTCQQCHKNAGISFPQAWLSHKTPSSTTLSGLYYANRFSLAAVVVAIIVIVAFIILDDRRRITRKIVIGTKSDE
jgi:hypothetical protein